MKTRYLLLALVFGASFAALAQPKGAILPFEPAQILATLPAAPADWATTRSDAETTLGDWLATRATRVFHGSPSAQTGQEPGTPAITPVEVEVTVTDTAGFPPSLAAFTSFTPGKNGNMEKKNIGSLPAIIFTGDDGRQLTQVLVSGRYIIELSTPQSDRVRVEDWLRGFHFDKLPAQSIPLVTSVQTFRLPYVDELHPENNRIYSVSTTSSNRISDFLKTLPTSRDN